MSHTGSHTGSYTGDVWSWQQHLRCGGTTTWSQWLAASDRGAGEGDSPGSPPPGWSAPGAAQLELLRRLALHAEPGGAGTGTAAEALATLADLVTSRTGPGRGRGQQPLPWPGAAPAVPGAGAAGPAPAPPARDHRVGAPPVDPARVPDEELVRVGVGVLTELLLSRTGDGRDGHDEHDEHDRDDGDDGHAGHRRRLWGLSRLRALPARARPQGRRLQAPALLVDGAPVTAAAVRLELGLGRDPGGPAPLVALLAEPFDQALAQAWSTRVQRGAPARWPGFVARWSSRRELPPSVDLPAIARYWSDRGARVHVVVAPGGFSAAARATAEVLGGRPAGAPGTRPDGRPAALTPAAVDLVRRLNGVLAVRAPAPRHSAALRDLLPLLPVQASRLPLTVPPALQPWARERAQQLAADLERGGYPVHGPLGRLVPELAGLPTRPRPADTLEVTLAACLGLTRRPASEGAVSGG